MVRMSRVVRFSVTNLPASGNHTRRVWMFTFCQRFVLMFECETFCARNLRFPVMSLLAMFHARSAMSGGTPRVRKDGGNCTTLNVLSRPGAALTPNSLGSLAPPGLQVASARPV
jgi:hypothetical protein